MSRPSLIYPDPDLAAEFVAQVSHDTVRELQAAFAPRHITPAERRENLVSLAHAVIDEHSWTVPAVLRPTYRPLVRYFATVEDPIPAFGRLMLAVAACNSRDTDTALDRLVAA